MKMIETTNNFIKETEKIETLLKESLNIDNIIDWDDESLLMIKEMFLLMNAYKDMLLQQASEVDYLTKTVTELNSKMDNIIKMLEDRA